MSKRAKKGYTGPRVKDTQTFIQKSLWRHGEVYDYSQVNYKGTQEKVEIVCEKHGPFWQVANDHVNSGAGCRDCKYDYMKEILSLTQEDFTSRSSVIHDSKYSYEKVVYKNNRTKVWITCIEHGDFFQTPDGHLQGEGCPKCKAVTIGNLKRKTLKEFVKQSKEVHGDKYDYSKVDYVHGHEKVKIGCPTHGVFEQLAMSHTRGNGCNQCWKERMSETLTTSEEDFIIRAREVHGDRFEYSDFTGFMNKVKVTCTVHGDFWQRPGNHIYHESGCPKCSLLNSQGWGAHKALYQTDEPSNIYLIKMQSEQETFLKIGLAKNIDKRHKVISWDSGCKVETVHIASGPANKLFKLEHMILHTCGFERFKPEEKFGGSSECLEFGQESSIVDFIEEHMDV